MRCKQGDMAVIIKSVAGNEGKIVTCIRLSPNIERQRWCGVGPWWIIDRELPTDIVGIPLNEVPDAWLKPIRNDPGKDETLEWKEVPKVKEISYE